MSNVTVEIPEELVVLARMPNCLVSNFATMFLALELFRERRASLGRAAELANISFEELMNFSVCRHVSFHYGDNDLAEDRQTTGFKL